MPLNQKNPKYELSKKHYDGLLSMLHPARYDAFMDNLIGKILTAGLLRESADDMKAKGRVLREASIHFKSVKHEMFGDHKTDIHKWIMEIRQSHDSFWGQYKNYQAERRELYALKQQAWEENKRAWEEKQKAWQEKSRQKKASIESNIESNKDKLYKANEALGRMERRKDELQSKIYDSNSDNWKSKAEEWLDELNDKIRSIEEQISRLEKWIEEGRDQLRNWK